MCRWDSICTFRSVASVASSAISASTPIRTPRDVETYVAALSREIELVSRLPVMGGRPFRFVYFGGGTPSFLSAKQLTSLVDRLRANIRWDHAEEVTFECEPGTLSEPKVHTLRDLGVTRLSLGVENFGDAVLEENGRAHLVGRSLQVLGLDSRRRLSERQHRSDLRHGRRDLGQLERQRAQDHRALARQRHHLSDGTAVQHRLFARTCSADRSKSPVADWPTKRAWVDYAFDELTAAGYAVSSAYTLVQRQAEGQLQLSRQPVARLRPAGHRRGQFRPRVGRALSEPTRLGRLCRRVGPRRAAAGRAACGRPPHQLLVREMILQLKTGLLEADYFRRKFGVEIAEHWDEVWRAISGRRLSGSWPTTRSA